MNKPFIVEIHLIITAGGWKSARSKIIKLLKSNVCKYYSVSPLYVNSDIEDTEIRICAQANNPDRLGEFVAKKIRAIKGVYATRVRLTLQGEIFPKGVSALAAMNNSQTSCHIFINTAAGKDEQVWRSLRRLKNKGPVFPVWVFRDFYDYGWDITLRVIGQEEKQIREYVDRNFALITGINTWRLKFMRSSVKILSKKRLFEIARNWFAKKLSSE
jgi:hypothetical protein